MKLIHLKTPCPSCAGPLKVSALECEACELELRGKVELNEFASLDSDDLHFLRVLVFAEGRIRDMEGPLGLSYPTIRTRLAKLKERVMASAPGLKVEFVNSEEEKLATPLEQLERGEIDFETALKSVQAKKKDAKGKKP
jgi:hypothetical protein